MLSINDTQVGTYTFEISFIYTLEQVKGPASCSYTWAFKSVLKGVPYELLLLLIIGLWMWSSKGCEHLNFKLGRCWNESVHISARWFQIPWFEAKGTILQPKYLQVWSNQLKTNIYLCYLMVISRYLHIVIVCID